jgi:hypothetical protein
MNSVVVPWTLEIGIISWRTLSGKQLTSVIPFAPFPAKSGLSGPAGSSPTIASGSSPKRPPLPSELLATFIAFGVCAILADSQQGHTAGVLLAWGLVLSTFMSQAGALAPAPKKGS